MGLENTTSAELPRRPSYSLSIEMGSSLAPSLYLCPVIAAFPGLLTSQIRYRSSVSG